MIKVTVPATTANLGPGFDAMGMALSQYSVFECEPADKIEIILEGLESEKLTVENNLVVNCMNRVFNYAGKHPEGYRLKIINGVPLARGMGSSASAIVGGLMCANALIGSPLSEDELLKLATEVEGHPDNVAPALLGNLIVSTTTKDGEVVFRSIEPFKEMDCVLFIPDYEVSTKDSRGVLPENVSMKDAVHNSSHLALLVLGFVNGDKELIGKTMDDRIHEPYRKKLIKNFDDFREAALNSGAFAFSLSGAGSTIIAYSDEENSRNVRDAFEKVAQENGISGKAVVIKPCSKGAVCEIN